MAFRISMSRLFLCFIFISSCSVIDYGYFDVLMEDRIQPRIDITKSYIEKSEYSFIKVKQGKKEATFVLLSSRDGIETWIGSNYERIYTFKGLIIRTYGLDQDIYYSPTDLSDVTSKFPSSSFSVTVTLTNPELDSGLLQMIYKESLSDSRCKLKVIYESLLHYTRAKSSSTFCYNNAGLPISSQQRINPAGQKVDLEFYYKF